MKMMMYRQCTIIGMSKNSTYVKEGLLLLLCFIAAAGIRIFLMVSFEIPVTDEFQYYQASMIRKEVQEPVMTSPAAFAYTQSLSRVFQFIGNRIQAVAGYHMMLQAAAFLFLFFGCRLLFGKVAAFFEAAVFAVSPWLILGIWQVSPENYYLAGWSFLFFLVGGFAKKTREKGWYRRSLDEFYLIFLGFLTGVICIWHCMGFLLLLLAFYMIAGNVPSLAEKRTVWKKRYALERLLKEGEEKEAEEDCEEIMSVSSQVLTLVMGIFLGGFSALMKYTGVTGEYFKDQLLWWLKLLLYGENGRWQDISLWLPVWLTVTILTGICLQAAFQTVSAKRTEKEERPEMTAEAEKKEETMDGREEKKKVNYIENPLPLPKKHVKRKLDFKIDKKKEDFDIEIDENDDFDI